MRSVEANLSRREQRGRRLHGGVVPATCMNHMDHAVFTEKHTDTETMQHSCGMVRALIYHARLTRTRWMCLRVAEESPLAAAPGCGSVAPRPRIASHQGSPNSFGPSSLSTLQPNRPDLSYRWSDHSLANHSNSPAYGAGWMPHLAPSRRGLGPRSRPIATELRARLLFTAVTARRRAAGRAATLPLPSQAVRTI